MSTIIKKDQVPMPRQFHNLFIQAIILLPRLFFSILVLCLLPIGFASANMVLSEAIVHFEPGKPLRKDIEVENPSTENLYVEITPAVVSDPGSEKEQRLTIVDPRESGLLVTPNKIVVPPGGRKLVRLVSLEPLGKKERVYRVTFKPVVGELESEQIGIKILIGYEVLVLMQPALPEPNLVATRNGKTMSFVNKGNTNILLREGKQCPENSASDSDECENLRGKRLYPGNRWSVELPYNKPVEYQMSIGTKNSVKTFK
jgi:P pilus assembly chaperone PapD